MALTDIEAGRLADNVFNVVGPNKNLIINGAMQVAQRGTSSTANSYTTVDRWVIDSGGGTRTRSQESLTTGTPYNEGFRNFLRITNTSAGSNNATDYVIPTYYVEAQDLFQSGWQHASSSSYITLSFWVRASVAQEYYVQLRTFDGTEQNYTFSTGSLTAGTWKKVTKTIPGNSSITVNNDNGRGLQISIHPFLGTDYTDSAFTVDTWAAYSSTSRAPDFTTTWNTTASATFDFTGVQLEVGQVATPFQHRSYGDELARCKRYYQQYPEIASDGYSGLNCTAGGCNGSNQCYGVFQLNPAMRAAPDFDSTGNFRVITAATTQVVNSFTTYHFAATSVFLAANCTSLTSGNNGFIARDNDTNAYVQFTAEL